MQGGDDRRWRVGFGVRDVSTKQASNGRLYDVSACAESLAQ